MRLTPTEADRLTIFTAAELARRRRAKGWKLTHPEALAIICDDMHEAAPDCRQPGPPTAGILCERADLHVACVLTQVRRGPPNAGRGSPPGRSTSASHRPRTLNAWASGGG